MTADPSTFPMSFAIARGFLRWSDMKGDEYLEVGSIISEEMARNGIQLIKLANARWKLTLPHNHHRAIIAQLTPLVEVAVSYLMGEDHEAGHRPEYTHQPRAGDISRVGAPRARPRKDRAPARRLCGAPEV